jgi:sulfide:quinone oxidoreductase
MANGGVPDSPTHVVILGGGFGGLELSTRLCEELGDRVQVTLIDQNDSFVFGFSKLDVMFGRRTPEEVRAYYRDIDRPNFEFRQETVTAIDPEAKRVRTDRGSYDADVLVVALGADLDPESTPGLLAAGHEFYSVAGAERLRAVLDSFKGGAVVIAVLGPFFKCPPAPYETAYMLHDHLAARGVRERSSIHVLTTLPSPIPISEEVSGAMVAMLEECDATYWPRAVVTRLDPETRTAHLEDGRSLAFDLFLGIPVHRAPQVVVESGLTEEGWIPVDPATFATRFADVYAVGDVTSAPVPRAGTIAEGEARTVADVLISTLDGGPQPAPYDGAALCLFESPGGAIGKVSVSFLAGPAPSATYFAPNAQNTEEKRAFGINRRRRWFGYPDWARPARP